MSKPLWVAIFILTGSLLLWRGSIAAWELYCYYRLCSETQGAVTNIEIIPKGVKYAHRVDYSYTYRGKPYTNTMLLSKPYYFNKVAAEAEKKKMAQMSWVVWVDPQDPKFSSLECKFPLRNSCYAVCLLGVLLYFLYLKIHLELLSKSM